MDDRASEQKNLQGEQVEAPVKVFTPEEQAEREEKAKAMGAEEVAKIEAARQAEQKNSEKFPPPTEEELEQELEAVEEQTELQKFVEEHDNFGFEAEYADEVMAVLEASDAKLQKVGRSIMDFPEAKIKALLEKNVKIHEKKEEEGEEKDTRKSYEQRRDELMRSKMSNSGIVNTLLQEYDGKLEGENAVILEVLKKYEAVLNLGKTKEEATAIERVMNSKPRALTAVGLSEFALSLYQLDDTEVSEETKEQIAAVTKVEYARGSSIKTGTQLEKVINERIDTDGDGEADSLKYTKERPLQLRQNVAVYSEEIDGKVVQRISIPGKGMDMIVQNLNPVDAADSIRRMANYALMRDVLDQSTEGRADILLGQDQGEDLTTDMTQFSNAETLMGALLPEFNDEYILSDMDAFYLKQSMNAMTNFRSLGRGEIKKDLKEIGAIYDTGDLNPDRLYIKRRNVSFSFA